MNCKEVFSRFTSRSGCSAASWLLAVALLVTLLPGGAVASGGPTPPKQKWSFDGVFGRFDNAALKRGAQVAVQSCMACHSIKYIKFDQLRQFGFTEAEVKALAESQGRTKKDAMLSSMDPAAAKESFGVVPPDLSLITKARKGYEDYTFGILTGYASESDLALAARVMADGKVSGDEAKEVASALQLDLHHPEKMGEVLKRISAGENFNRYFPGHFFAMPQPLSDGAVAYTDGTENSKVQLSRDVVTFLAWAAEPTMMERKSLGLKVLLYLFVLTVMLYAVKRRIWAKVH
ncbi:MAG: cytochrome c1 [Magnetococcus sp. YQC-3]